MGNVYREVCEMLYRNAEEERLPYIQSASDEEIVTAILDEAFLSFGLLREETSRSQFKEFLGRPSSISGIRAVVQKRLENKPIVASDFDFMDAFTYSS